MVNGGGLAGTLLFNHSILTGSAIWRRQAAEFSDLGWRVICLDTRGHGQTPAVPGPYTMSDLVEDNIRILDFFEIDQAHFVGVSQGGMTGFGLAIDHSWRLASLCVCAARADAPPAFAAAWEERIMFVGKEGVNALAIPTVERWFGAEFLQEKIEVAEKLVDCIRQTTIEGFVGCARAIQGLDYLHRLSQISVPTSLIVGTRDEGLLQPMRDLAPKIPHSVLTEIAGGGHLPQIDRPHEFDAALTRHLSQFVV